MRHLINADVFINIASRLEQNRHIFENMVFPDFSGRFFPDSPQSTAAISLHTDFVLRNFNSFEEIVEAELTLMRNGYDPVLLVLENGYTETLEAVRLISEGFWSSAWSIAKTLVSNDQGEITFWTVFQFILDVIGVIPWDWGGIPINEVANFVNMLLYFFGPNQNAMLGALSLIGIIPVFGSALKGTLRVAFLPFTHVLTPLFKWIALGDKPSVIKAVAGVIETPGSAKVIGPLIELFSKGASALKSVGLKMVKAIVEFFEYILTHFGFNTSSLTKFGSKLEAKILKLSSGFDEAGELLTKGSAEARAALTDAGNLAAKSGVKDLPTLQKFMNPTKFADDLAKEAMTTPAFQKLAANASQKVQQKFISNEVTKKLVAEVVEGTSAKSLISVLRDPHVVRTLTTKYGKNGLDGILMKALKQKSPGDIVKVLDDVVSSPELLKVLDERAVKAVSLFRAYPEMLIKGVPKYQKAIGAIPSLSKALKLGEMKLFHRKVTTAQVLTFIAKMFIRKSECLKWITAGDVTSTTSRFSVDKVMASTKTSESTDTYSRIYEEDETSQIIPTPEELEQLKANDPESYALFMKTEADATSAIETLAPSDPCSLEVTTAQAAASNYIPDNFVSNIYQENGMGDSYTGITVGGEEDDTAKKLRLLSQNYLRAVGQDPNIEPQRPLSATDPYTKAYLSDAYDWSKNEFIPNTGDQSRLDQTLDLLVKNGELEEGDRESVYSATVDHWKNGTTPEKFKEMLSTGGYDSPSMYERVSNLKVSGVKPSLIQIR